MDFLFNHLKLMLFEKVTRENIFQIKDFNVMIDGKTFFNQPVKNNLRTYDMITFKRSQMVQEMITQLVVYWVVSISKIIIR